MPKGPNGQKRPADAIGLAVMVGRIATGEVEDTQAAVATEKRQAAGRKGAKARIKALSPSERSEIASVAASARWKKG